jgi:hypothetical protein
VSVEHIVKHGRQLELEHKKIHADLRRKVDCLEQSHLIVRALEALAPEATACEVAVFYRLNIFYWNVLAVNTREEPAATVFA